MAAFQQYSSSSSSSPPQDIQSCLLLHSPSDPICSHSDTSASASASGVGANLLWAEWISFSMTVSLFGLLTLYCSHSVPEALQRVFRYGKTAQDQHQHQHQHQHNHDHKLTQEELLRIDTDSVTTGRKRKQKIEIPKKWFYHFYVFATLFYVLLLCAVVKVYVFGQNVPQLLQLLLDALVGKQRRSNVCAESVLLAMVLIQIQVTRRLYECLQLSVYSDSGKMALVHYLCGFSFYFGVGLSLLAEAQGFTTSATATATTSASASASASSVNQRKDTRSQSLQEEMLWWRVVSTWQHVFGTLLFLFSSFVQFKSHVILARLRQDSKGRVVTYGHSIPRGHWFELVSCPHYFAEILIYLSISVVLAGRSTTWWMVCSFVVCNQVIVGLFNHRWYLKTFPKDYPKDRKAVLPFII